MKKIITILIFILLGSCHEDSIDPRQVHNVVLYDTSIPEIENYLKGQWRLNLRVGGLSGNEKTVYCQTFYDFTFQPSKHFTRIDSGVVTIDSPITWNKYPISARESAFSIDYKFPTGVPFGFYPKEIKNDTLLLVENCSDCYVYYLSRSN